MLLNPHQIRYSILGRTSFLLHQHCDSRTPATFTDHPNLRIVYIQLCCWAKSGGMFGRGKVYEAVVEGSVVGSEGLVDLVCRYYSDFLGGKR